MIRAITAAGLVAAWTVGSPAARAELPPVERLFGCPILAPQEAFETPEEWVRHELPSAGVSLALPPDWEVVHEHGVPVVDRDQAYIWLRRGHRVGAERLPFVRRALELRELGPSHAGPDCERSLVERLRRATRFEHLLAGVYARPLGWRRRHYALYVGLPDGGGSLALVVRLRWDRLPADGPDLALLRRLLGGVRPSTGDEASAPGAPPVRDAP